MWVQIKIYLICYYDILNAIYLPRCKYIWVFIKKLIIKTHTFKKFFSCKNCKILIVSINSTILKYFIVALVDIKDTWNAIFKFIAIQFITLKCRNKIRFATFGINLFSACDFARDCDCIIICYKLPKIKCILIPNFMTH